MPDRTEVFHTVVGFGVDDELGISHWNTGLWNIAHSKAAGATMTRNSRFAL